MILQTLYGIADMESSLARLETARAQSPLAEPLRKVMLLNASVSRDSQAAQATRERFVSHIVSGWPDEVLKTKGIDPQAIQEVREGVHAENRGVDYAAASLTPDEAVDRLIIAGSAGPVRRNESRSFSLAARDGFRQITLGVPLGPDIPEVIKLWGEEILPIVAPTIAPRPS